MSDWLKGSGRGNGCQIQGSDEQDDGTCGKENHSS